MKQYEACVCDCQEDWRDIMPCGYQLPPMSLVQERRLARRGNRPERIGEILRRSFPWLFEGETTDAFELTDTTPSRGSRVSVGLTESRFSMVAV